MSWFDLVKQAVDSVENQLDTILDQTNELDGGGDKSTSITSAAKPTTTTTSSISNSSGSADIFSRLKINSISNATSLLLGGVQEVGQAVGGLTAAVATQQYADQPMKKQQTSQLISGPPSNPGLSETLIDKVKLDGMNSKDSLVKVPLQPSTFLSNHEGLEDQFSQIQVDTNTPDSIASESPTLEVSGGWGVDDDELASMKSPRSSELGYFVSRLEGLEVMVAGNIVETQKDLCLNVKNEKSSGEVEKNGEKSSVEKEKSNEKSSIENENGSSEREIIEELKRSLLQREQQLMKSKQENADLFNQIDLLGTQLSIEQTQKAELFTFREKILAEKESLQKSSHPDLAKIISEKEASIAGLLQEG